MEPVALFGNTIIDSLENINDEKTSQVGLRKQILYADNTTITPTMADTTEQTLNMKPKKKQKKKRKRNKYITFTKYRTTHI